MQVTTDIQRQTQLYVLGLSVSAAALCVGLLLAGYDLEGDPWTVLALDRRQRGGGAKRRLDHANDARCRSRCCRLSLLPFSSGRWRPASSTPRRCWATPSCCRGLTLTARRGSSWRATRARDSSPGRPRVSWLRDSRGHVVRRSVGSDDRDARSCVRRGGPGHVVRSRHRPDSRTQHPGGVLRTLGPLLLTSVPLYAPTVAVLAFAYTEVSPWTALLFFIPALAAQRLFGMYQQQRQLAEDLKRANMSFAEALVATLEKSDQYTAGHSKAVAIYSRDIAERMGLLAEVQERTYLCGLVHDIGKIGLPASLLLKDGPLTLEERRQMQEHPAIGEGDLEEGRPLRRRGGRRSPPPRAGRRRGLPGRARGRRHSTALARSSRVADAYNAMTSNRAYRDAMPSRVARLRLAQAVESQFDTTAVAAFEAILAGATEEYRTATTSRL